MNEKNITGVDTEGNVVEFKVVKPVPSDYKLSQIVYSKALRTALDGGALLKDKIHEYVKEQNIWDDKKEAKSKEFVSKIRQAEFELKKGGIPLKKAKEIALKLHSLREDFRNHIAEKQAVEAGSAENFAETAKFNYFVSRCVVRPDGTRFWNNEDEYDKDAFQPWAIQAASEVAKMLYGLDPDYDKNLVENKFLVKWKFVDENLRLINSDGHLVDSEGRLIDAEGNYVAYRDNGEVYFVDSDGRALEVEFSPFTDDEGNVIPDGE